MKDTYIKTVKSLLEAGNEPEMVLSGLATTLKQRGHEKLQAAVLRGVIKLLQSKSTHAPMAVVGNSKDREVQMSAIKTALQSLGVDSTPKVVVDDSIIGGFIATYNHQRIDASYKTQLVQLYRTLTN